MTQNVPKNRPKSTPQIPQMLILGRWGHSQGPKNPSRHVTQKVVRPCSNHFPSNRPSRPQNPDRRRRRKKEEDFSGISNNLLVIWVTYLKMNSFLEFFNQFKVRSWTLKICKNLIFSDVSEKEWHVFNTLRVFKGALDSLMCFSKGRPYGPIKHRRTTF
jgi:hypothetical protein